MPHVGAKKYAVGILRSARRTTSILVEYIRDARGSSTEQRALFEETLSLHKILKRLLNLTDYASYDLAWFENRRRSIQLFQETFDDLLAMLNLEPSSINPMARLPPKRILTKTIRSFKKSDLYRMTTSVVILREHAVEILASNDEAVDLRSHLGQYTFLLMTEEHLFSVTDRIVERAKGSAVESDTGVCFLAAVSSDDIQEAGRLLAAEDLGTKTETYTPLGLFLAVERANTEMIKLLLLSGVDIEAKDDIGQTSLHRATRQENPEIMKMLLEHGAQVDSMDDDGLTPWSASLDYHNEYILSILLEAGADPNTRASLGVNPIYIAAANGNADLVRYMLQSGTNPSILTDFGWAPLHWAAFHGYIECVRLLLEAGADLDPVSDQRKTPLDLAKENDHTKIIDLLTQARMEQWKDDDSFVVVDTPDEKAGVLEGGEEKEGTNTN